MWVVVQARTAVLVVCHDVRRARVGSAAYLLPGMPGWVAPEHTNPGSERSMDGDLPLARSPTRTEYYMRSFRFAVVSSVLGALVLVSASPVVAADTVNGSVGSYRTFDSRSDPSTLCAYPVGGSRLTQFRARGPRVDFPSKVGQVGWVDWRALVQRKTEAGAWRTIARRDPLRRTVTVGFSKTFPTIAVPVNGPAGVARIRLVNRLDWFDQGDHRVGKVRHVVQNYGWDRYAGDSDPISFDQIQRRSTGSCANRWPA